MVLPEDPCAQQSGTWDVGTKGVVQVLDTYVMIGYLDR